MSLIVTKPSHTLRQQNHRRYSRRIADTLKDREDAKSQGDLSENFGYIEAGKELENLRRTQSQLGLDGPLEIVDPHTWVHTTFETTPSAKIGAVVEISRNNGRKETLIIGGAWDIDLTADNLIPYNCPLAKLLIAQTPGFKGTLPTNGQEITLLGVRAPSESELHKAYSEIKPKQPQPEMAI